MDLKKIVVYSHLAYSFPIIVGGTTLVGYLIDRGYKKFPIFTIIFFLFGLISGFYNVFKTLKSFEDKE